jgi:predicted phage gp36 major capsid-like protein
LSRHVEITADFILNDGELLYGPELLAYAQRMSKEASDAVHLNDEQAQRVFRAEAEAKERDERVENLKSALKDERNCHGQTVADLKRISSEMIKAENERAESAERELAECRKDAERYRWLRETGTKRGVIDWGALRSPYQDLVAMDAAIDNAMDEGRGK